MPFVPIRKQFRPCRECLKLGFVGLTGRQITRTTQHVSFFSSRRRLTRFARDWSSDVCSSDLAVGDRTRRHGGVQSDRSAGEPVRIEIGRESCRERVEISVVAVSLKNKKE